MVNKSRSLRRFTSPRRGEIAGAVVALIAFALSGLDGGAFGQETETTSRQNAVIVASLFRTTMIALHQANVTGNYTVLRDLAAPSFRERNSAADLAAIFAGVRREKIDLGVVVVTDPQFTAAPRIDERRMLRIAGSLQTRPLPVNFELVFQAVDNEWRLFGISITPVRPVAAAPAANPPAAKARQPSLPVAARPPGHGVAQDTWFLLNQGATSFTPTK